MPPIFQDQKIRLALSDSIKRYSGDFSKYVESTHDYQVSSDPAIAALERAYFSDMLASEEWSLPTSVETIEILENRLLPVLAEMEAIGAYVHAPGLRNIADELATKTRKLEIEMRELVGESFNPNSPKQIQYVLFERLGIPKTKKIKTGFSVDSEALEEIAKNYAIAGIILEYRSFEKLRTTYAEGLLKEVGADGRIHTTYNQVLTSTGRISSENPNLQNIPSGDGYAGQIKAAFCPKDPSWRYLVADYSQVELRILAILSGDEALKKAFSDGRDIHTETAKFLFPGSKEITKEQRRIAKTVNFGVIYGITGFGLSKTVGTSPTEASRYIDTFFERYSRVRAYYDEILAKAREMGYVETSFGRRRYIKGLNDSNQTIRKSAEREAMNMPVQGTAADVIKFAMIDIAERLKNAGMKSRMIMQVHDELVFEGPETEMSELEILVQTSMEGVLKDPTVTLFADIAVGKNWFDAKG